MGDSGSSPLCTNNLSTEMNSREQNYEQRGVDGVGLARTNGRPATFLQKKIHFFQKKVVGLKKKLFLQVG